MAAIISKEADELLDDDLLIKQPLAAEPKQQPKAVAIVRPQPQQLNNNTTSEDREARFSLYDFPSDSETEAERPSSSKAAAAAREARKATPPQQQRPVPLKKQFSTTAATRKIFTKSASKKPDEPQPAAASAASTSSSNAEKMQVDQDARPNHEEQPVLSSRPSHNSHVEVERSSASSRSASSCDELKVKSMGDRQPQQPQQPPSRPQQQQQASASAAAAAASGLMSQHYALQYQAAMQQAFSAGAAGNHLAQAQLLAYQQSLQAALTPDMILKQYPHLAAAGLAAPPHLLGGRNPAADHHLMLQQQAREREMAQHR